MPTYQLTVDDGLGWLETIKRLSSREACYRRALSEGEGDYIILLDGEPDRELHVAVDGTLLYRIPGSHNWHPWQPR